MWLERVLRGTVLLALAVMLWQSLRKQSDSGSEVIETRELGRGLAEWSALGKAPDRIHLRLDSVPSALERAWLGALAGAGSSVSWSGIIPALMIEAEPFASPLMGTRILVAAPRGSLPVISDDVGVIDTLRGGTAGASVALNSAPQSVAARLKGAGASAVQRDSTAIHKVLVIGEAGWESKFVVAALEADGWKVDALIRLAPGIDVTQGTPAVIDTSRYSAVIALDAAASSYAARIIAFARMGGGVILAPRAASVAAMAPFRAAAVDRGTVESRESNNAMPVSLAALPLVRMTSLRSDAVPLGMRGGATTIAARRTGAGRLLQLAYEDTWRWRMGGSENAVRDHQKWWSALVSEVAYAPSIPRATTESASDEAPMAGLVAAIGSSTEAPVRSALERAGSDWMLWLFTLLVVTLIFEVASRRLRGAS